MKDFLEFCENKNLPVDFISTHPYPTDFAVDVTGTSRGFSRVVSSIKRDLILLKEMVEAEIGKNNFTELDLIDAIYAAEDLLELNIRGWNVSLIGGDPAIKEEESSFRFDEGMVEITETGNGNIGGIGGYDERTDAFAFVYKELEGARQLRICRDF